jgi:hypothetical protein
MPRWFRCSSVVALLACLAFCASAAANSSPWTGFNENVWVAPWDGGTNYLTPLQLAQADQDEGASVDRTTIDWSAVEQAQGACEPGGTGTCNWGSLDDYYTDLTGQQPNTSQQPNPYNPNVTPRIRPLFTIIDVPPVWAFTDTQQCQQEDQSYNQTGTGPTCSGWNEQWYADFAASVAKRYPYAAGIEVWNEENGSTTPANTSPQAGECTAQQLWCWGTHAYALLLQDVYQTVHPLTQDGTVAADMKVLFGGLSAYIQANETSQGQWLADVFSAWGGPVYMDGISVHPYSSCLGDDLQNLLLDEVRDVRDDYGASATPLYVTESGISTASTMDPNLKQASCEPVDDAEQALEIAHVWNALGPQPDIAAVLTHTLIDSETGGKLDDGGFGLLDNNSGKPDSGLPTTPNSGWFGTVYRMKPAFCVNAQLHANGFQCPTTVTVPSLSAQPASGNFQAQIDLQAAYEVAREYYHAHGAFDGITNSYLHSQNPTLSPSAPSQPNNPGTSANPAEIDVVQASANGLEICNSGTGDTSYCISRTDTPPAFTTSYANFSYDLPVYKQAVKPTTGDTAALSGTPAWSGTY